MFSGSTHEDENSGNSSNKVDSLAPAAITDTGCERELNEDRYAVIESESGVAWIVCDGMGGVTGGELAAQLAIDAIRREFMNNPCRPSQVAVTSSLAEANRIIVLRRQNQAFSGMGTTAVMALFQGQEVAISHIGDSRAYLVRDRVIQQLTVDHTYVQSLVEKGEITLEEALAHPDAHILTRCIGSQSRLDLDVIKLWLWPTEKEEPKDKLVMVSDGLYSLVTDEEISEIVATKTAQDACAHLVDMANERGGYDNITVVIVPLDGQLRSEVPPGFTPVKEVEQKASRISTRSRIYYEDTDNSKTWILIGIALLLLIAGLVFSVFYLTKL